MEGSLAGGAEEACPGAGEEGEKGTEVGAGGALVGGGEGGVQIGEGYPICGAAGEGGAEDGWGVGGDVVVLVQGVDEASRALANAAEGGECGEVHREEYLSGQLGREGFKRAKGVCWGEDESCGVLGAVEGQAPVEIGVSGAELVKMRCVRRCQTRHICRDELGGWDVCPNTAGAVRHHDVLHCISNFFQRQKRRGRGMKNEKVYQR